MTGETNNISALNFQKINIPLPVEPYYNTANDASFIHWGLDNLYPNFLLKLYGESPIHQAIINSKVTYLVGDGFKYNNGEPLSVKVNAVDTFESFINKVVKDFLIFNFFAVEVVYNAFMQPIEYHHVPAQKIRMNKSKTKFWFSNDWFHYRTGQLTYQRWAENVSDSTTKLFFFDGYNPSLSHVYPSPEYEASIKSISTDIAITDFNLNNIKNNFSVASLLTFYQGTNVSDEVKRAVTRDIENTYTGEFGKKIIIDFQQTNGKSADVQQLSDNSWADAYTSLQESVTDSILRGHAVTSPTLMGIKTAGQWQGNSGAELETAYEIFKNTYIKSKRSELLAGINLLFTNSTIITQPLICTDKALFQTTISDSLIQQVYLIDEIRKLAGLPPLPNGAGNKLLSNTQAAPDKPNSFEDESIKKKSIIQLSEDDFEKIKHLGTAFEEFETVDEYSLLKFDTQSDIASWVIKNDVKGLSIAELRNEIGKDGINVSVSELGDILRQLDTAGVIKVNTNADGKIAIEPNTKADVPKTRKVETMYQYEVRPGYGKPIIENTRSFCRKLIENNRLYTREEIQEMSNIFGYDIFTYCGGFYHNPQTEETTSHCRHQFKQKLVTRKAT